jgi:predicted GNAT family N-acyltransferase
MALKHEQANIEVSVVETSADREAVFALRMKVFVEEQRVPPDEELDAYDVAATHFAARVRDGRSGAPSPIVATARLVDKGGAIGKVGRVAVLPEYRGMGVGAALMKAIHRFARERRFRRLELEAQCYAIPFYEKLGYTAAGDVFLDANIEHRCMSLDLTEDAEHAAAPRCD